MRLTGYLRVLGVVVGADGVVGDGLSADVAEGPEDAGAHRLGSHRVGRHGLLVPSPIRHSRRILCERVERIDGGRRGTEGSVNRLPYALFPLICALGFFFFPP